MSRSSLAPPAGRQGPGRIPPRLLEALDLVVAKRTAGALPGDRRASGMGTGTELAQMRPYEVGDDVRQIDPSATARMGEPYVRMQVPERTLTTWLVVDVSPSMAFGTAQRLKSDVAEGIAGVVAQLAVRRAGRVALVSFGAGRPRLLAPRAARRGVIAVRRALAAGVATDGTQDPDALSHALVRLREVATQPGLVVVVSDFRDHRGWERALGAVSALHSVLAVEVRDPREGSLPDVGHLALVDPETGEHVEVDTANPGLRERFARVEAERRARVASELRRLQVQHAVVTTAGDWLRDFGRAIT